MYNTNQPSELFRGQKIEIYLKEKENQILNDIKNYPEAAINEIDFEEESDKIIKHSKLDVPKLLKDKTTTGISKLLLSGNQLPPGTPFQHGKKYEIEIADYRVPFSGNSDFFRILPKKFHNRSLAAVNNRESITFRMTNYGQITGNDLEIEMLKREFLSNIEATEMTLKQIEEDINEFLPTLKNTIIQKLENRKQELITKNSSIDKLNPFK